MNKQPTLRSPALQNPTRFPSRSHSRRGFTRLELCAAVTALVALAAVCLPALAGNKPSTDRAVCFNNLRLIGRAVDMFMADHQETTPWRTPESKGGTHPGAGNKPANAWSEFTFLSNNISHPRILACPADAAAKVATDFAGTPTSYSTSGMRGNATSYTLGLDIWTPTAATLILSTDFNLRFDGRADCSAGVMNVPRIASSQPLSNQVAWTNNAHINAGQVLRIDGSVIFMDTAQLKQAMRTGDDNGSVHMLPAR